ncbi:hypothetical protein [Streptomyces sp. NPDC056061]|uniref:hypothetical protein n=1 Tax=Streptomyces sp. NPDC056061 TaxID=3345700 RepID=UPI0035D97F6D
MSGTDHGNGLSVRDPHDRFEPEAEANATRAMSRPVGHSPGRRRGGSVRPAPVGETGATGPAIQRVPVRVAADSIGSRSVVNQATGERGTFHDLYPVNDRRRELLIYNDLGNLQIVHASCNDIKSNDMTNTQFKMDVKFLVGAGAHNPERYLS